MNGKIISSTILLCMFLAACQSAARQTPAAEPEGELVANFQGGKEAALPAPANTSEQPNALNYADAGERMVIKDAEISLLVREVDPLISHLNALTADYHGYIIDTRTWFEDEYKYASMRLGIPAGSFEMALSDLRELGLQVLNETASGQDVTAEYVDLESKLTNLEATAARVRQFLERANTVDEALQVNQKLSELEGQIEGVKGKMKFYENRAAISTVTINLMPELPEPTPVPEPGWNPGDMLGRAIGVLGDLGKVVIDAAIWMVVVLGPVAAVAGLFLWAANRWLRGRKVIQ